MKVFHVDNLTMTNWPTNPRFIEHEMTISSNILDSPMSWPLEAYCEIYSLWLNSVGDFTVNIANKISFTVELTDKVVNMINSQNPEVIPLTKSTVGGVGGWTGFTDTLRPTQ